MLLDINAETIKRYKMNVARQTYIKRFGIPEVTLEEKENEALHVVIVTKRLRMSSISKEELDHHLKLFGDATVMAKYATGDTKDKEMVEQRIDFLSDRWKNKNAFSGFSIWLKNEDNNSEQDKDNQEFLGHAFLDQADEPNSAELGYALHANQWNKGYASEAAGAVVLFYARKLASAEYKLPNGNSFKRILGTVKTDNPASSKILERIGFNYYKQNKRFGSLRNYYELQIDDLLKET